MTAVETKKTPLHAFHKKLKAKMVPFGGWDMPVQYESVLAEHKWVREECGIFDVSHMGEIVVSGDEALPYLQKLTVNDLSKLEIGHGQYSALPTEDAGFVDDLIIYRTGEKEYFLCVNASNVDKDFAWLSKHVGTFKVSVKNESANWAQLAIQGPKSEETLAVLLSAADKNTLSNLPYTHIMTTTIHGHKSWIARTGYTGEKGYEIYIPNAIAEQTFAELLEKTSAKPIGLGARDTLRLEACYLLYGNDMDETVSPIEAGISWAVRFEKGDFLGKAKMEAQKAGTLPARKMVAFKLEDDGIARHGMDVYVGDKKVGTVTSGSVLPTVEGAGGMALIAKDAGNIGDTVEIDIRGKRKLARLVKRPLYSAKVK